MIKHFQLENDCLKDTYGRPGPSTAQGFVPFQLLQRACLLQTEYLFRVVKTVDGGNFFRRTVHVSNHLLLFSGTCRYFMSCFDNRVDHSVDFGAGLFVCRARFSPPVKPRYILYHVPPARVPISMVSRSSCVWLLKDKKQKH